MTKKLRISIHRLREIVAEELEDLFPGHDELKTLANGVTEAEEIEEMNPYHSSAEDGRFTGEEKSDCESLYFHNGTRKGKGPKHTSGRGRRRNGQGEFKCSTGERKPVSEGKAEQDTAYIKALVKAELETALSALQARLAKSRTGCSPSDLLAFMDRYSRASDGELSKKQA